MVGPDVGTRGTGGAGASSAEVATKAGGAEPAGGVIRSIKASTMQGFGNYPNGLIGAKFLRRFAGVTFDYPNRKVYFIPNPMDPVFDQPLPAPTETYPDDPE